MVDKITPEILREAKDQILSRIYSRHLRLLNNSDGNVFYISDTYIGVWLEHVFDGITWSKLNPDAHIVSDNYVRLFIKNQKPDGQLPCYVWADQVGYGQIQECVAFGRLCLEAVDLNPQDTPLLADCYKAVEGWVGWLAANRMTRKMGLVETFCGYDTGHDESGRFFDVKYPYNLGGDAAVQPTDDPLLPMLSPDVNACYYGNLSSLAEMAERLGYADKVAYWKNRAEEVKKRLFEVCFDEESCFFYDVDKNGNFVKVKSISITNVLTERALDHDLALEIIDKHLMNPKEFWTPYPFPAVAIDDPTWLPKLKGNSWGYFSQGNTALRTLRWMEHYGRGKELEKFMHKWLSAWLCETRLPFGQELHPITGLPSESSPYYSTNMLFLLTSMKRLYGI